MRLGAKILILMTAVLLCAAALLSAGCAATVAATPTPTPIPTPTPSPTPTPVPTPTPTPPPVPELIESVDMPFPGSTGVLRAGIPFAFGGTVRAVDGIASVTVRIDGTVYAAELTRGATEYDFYVKESSGLFIWERMNFGALTAGEHTFAVTVTSVAGVRTHLEQTFSVSDEEWTALLPNNFRLSYTRALEFFGDEERFMFSYRFMEGRHIEPDPEWFDRYMTVIPGINGTRWRVHIDAVPYYKAAREYLENTYVRVHSNDRDSGVIRLTDIMISQSGPQVSRFVTDTGFLSHHTYGTAIDINHRFKPNGNSYENKAVTAAEVALLQYNGIMTEGSRQYYDFTYTGEWPTYRSGVPMSVANYLLYELAFYRAGFAWGYYYPHTSDGMHFTLTDLSPAVHDTGLRKVFEYIP